MKDKRIWIVIGCILVIGTGVTHYTRYYVRSQGDALMSETTAGAGEMTITGSSPASVTDTRDSELANMAPGGEASAAPGNRRMAGAGPGASGTDAVSRAAAPASEAADGVMPGSPSPYMAGDTLRTEGTEESGAPRTAMADAEEDPARETQAAQEAAPISPLAGARISEYKASQLSDYRRRLEDLDSQILKMREEETDSNVYSIKTSAESELKMWESELNSIYNTLLEMLSREDAAALASEQQDWLKNRDARAAEASGKNSGGSMDSISYAAALAGLTRDRAYELAGRCEEAGGLVLDETEPQPAAP